MRLIWSAVFSALFSTLTFGLSFSVHAASFDCAKAATAPEKMICASSTLGALDENLAAAYKAATNANPNTIALVADQRQWLKMARNACKDPACIEKEIKARIGVLSRWDEDDVPGESIYGNYVLTHEVGIVNGREMEKTKVDDCLVIKKSPQNKLGIDFFVELVQANAHLCSLSGKALLEGNTYHFVPGKDEDEELMKCKFKLIVKRHTIRLEDADGVCRKYACGARAGLDSAQFLRSKKVAKSCENEPR